MRATGSKNSSKTLSIPVISLWIPQQSSDVAAQGFLTPRGRKVLLANKRNRPLEVEIPGADNAGARTVDEQTGNGPARIVKLAGGKILLAPFSVTVVSW